MVGKQGRSRRDIVGAARVTALQVGAEGPHIAAAAVAAGIAALLGGVDRVAGAVAIHVDGQHIPAHICLQAGLLRQLQLRTSSICLASQEHSTIPGECWELTEPWPSLTARLRQHGHMQGRMCHIIELHPWSGTISGEQWRQALWKCRAATMERTCVALQLPAGHCRLALKLAALQVSTPCTVHRDVRTT